MPVAFDASMLVYVVTPDASAPIDPTTGQPVTRCIERIDLLLEKLAKADERVVIPTPALAEVLVKAADAAAEYLAQLMKSKHFSVRSFDMLAAIEHADIQRQRKMSVTFPKASSRPKAKFDDQIVAISRVASVGMIYSDDPDIRQLCKFLDIECVGIAELPLPPDEPQLRLNLKPPDPTP